MNEVTVNVEEEAQAVAGVLREYAAKLAEYNAETVGFLETAYEVGEHNYGRIAWMLDRFEMINRPLQRMLSRASGLVEHSALAPRTHDEMDLRLRELEAHLHHADRHTRDLHALVGTGKHAQEVAKLRYAAGLPANRSPVAKPA